ncbi:MAG: type II toxin-antitoxin system RelE/ParE family toxin, partial [Chloroflexota bacterium]|nr:type II toxin-antitoxin system RelE/ParE family toxin [Chloroflexota bacterium]
ILRPAVHSRYHVKFVSSRVKRESVPIPQPDRDRIAEAPCSLAGAPRPYGIKQLGSDVYRLRVGNCRVIYRVLDDEHLVTVSRVCRRTERTYRQWRQSFEEPAEYDAESTEFKFIQEAR